MSTYYITDGTPEAFFTAVFDAYTDQTAYITSSPVLQTGLGDRFETVTADSEKCKRVVKKLEMIDKRSLFDLSYLLRTPDIEREQLALSYIRLLVKRGEPVREMLAEKDILRAMNSVQKVIAETHRMKGFLRFKKAKNGVFYAPFSPDNDIIDLVFPHFSARFSRISFVIHDVLRGIAGVWDGKNSRFFAAPKAKIEFSEDENFETLWKKYYQSVNIESRKHEKQMKCYLPVRYWRFLCEMQDFIRAEDK